MFQNSLKNQYNLGLQGISRKSVKVKSLTYHVTNQNSPRAKTSRFQFTQYGSRLFLGLLFVIDVSSDPSKFCDDYIGRLKVG